MAYSRHEVAFFAGLFTGEGHARCFKRRVGDFIYTSFYLDMGMAERPLMEEWKKFCEAIAGDGVSRKLTERHPRVGHARKQILYHYSIGGEAAERIAARLLPYMSGTKKADQIRTALSDKRTLERKSR